MLRKIEQLRKAPKEVRNRYAFLIAFLFTAVVTIFWITSLPARMQVFTGIVPQKETESSLTRMLQNMKASVINGSSEIILEPKKDEVQQMTMDEFMASTSSQKQPVALPGRPILIATSSVVTSTSSTR